MLGVIVNTFTVIVGSIIGLLFKKGIPERVTSAIMKGIGSVSYTHLLVKRKKSFRTCINTEFAALTVFFVE